MERFIFGEPRIVHEKPNASQPCKVCAIGQTLLNDTVRKFLPRPVSIWRRKRQWRPNVIRIGGILMPKEVHGHCFGWAQDRN
jgi:hypothetical protein